MIFKAFSRSLREDEKSSFKIVESDIESVVEFFPELDQKSICIYFYARELVSDGKPAKFIPLNHPQYCSKIRNIRNMAEFSIVFSKAFTSLEEIDRYQIIIHEFQHVVQYIKSKKEYLYSCILRDYGRDGSGFPDLKIPIEIDSDRKAKGILIKIYGKDKVEEFINGFSLSCEIKKQIFGDYYSQLNLEENYVFEDETMKIWNEKNIDAEIEKLRAYPSKFQKRILENYEFANK